MFWKKLGWSGSHKAILPLPRTNKPSLQALEARLAPAGDFPVVALPFSLGAGSLVSASGDGKLAILSDDGPWQEVTPFPGYHGPLNVATLNLGGGTTADTLAVAVGEGGRAAPHVILVDAATGEVRRSFYAFDSTFTGGVSLGAGPARINGAVTSVLVCGMGPGAESRVSVVKASSGETLSSFLAFEQAYRGGVLANLSQPLADGTAWAVVTSRVNGHITAFDLATQPTRVASFLADPSKAYAHGLSAVAGDMDRDGRLEFIAGDGNGSGLRVLNSQGQLRKELQAFDPGFTGGVTTGLADVNRDGFLDLLAASGPGAPGTVNAFDYSSGRLLDARFVADSRSGVAIATNLTPGRDSSGFFTLQVLHASDFEAGVSAIQDAPRFAAITDKVEDLYPHSITLSSGDNFLPGPFFKASGDASMASLFGNQNAQQAGRGDILILNRIGVQASAMGNHDFDEGTDDVREIFGAKPSEEWAGADFPMLSSNLDFTRDLDGVAPLLTPGLQEASTIAGKIAPTAIITENGERIGLIGLTTPMLRSLVPALKNDPDVSILPGETESDNTPEAMAPIVNAAAASLEAAGVNKIILLAHLQQLSLERGLAPLLKGVDIIIAGGSHTILANPGTTGSSIRPGDIPAGAYPDAFTGADGNPVWVVNTGANYTYLGRLVVDFDASGVIARSYDQSVSGGLGSNQATVNALWASADPFGSGTRGAAVKEVTDRIAGFLNQKDGELFGRTSVYLNGTSPAVRQQETNLGDLINDANLFAASAIDPAVRVALSNGGGVRDSIGEIDPATGAWLPTAANPPAGKQSGDISVLDIENAQKFNNNLSLISVTPQGLRQLLEYGVQKWDGSARRGEFLQVAGLRFSFDPNQPAGDRVRNLAIVDEQGKVIDAVVRDGQLVGDPARVIRLVTIDFIADGAEGFPQVGTDLVRLTEGSGRLTEQSAMKSYLQARFPIGGSAVYNQADDNNFASDTRIQNLNYRQDQVFGT